MEREGSCMCMCRFVSSSGDVAFANETHPLLSSCMCVCTCVDKCADRNVSYCSIIPNSQYVLFLNNNGRKPMPP